MMRMRGLVQTRAATLRRIGVCAFRCGKLIAQKKIRFLLRRNRTGYRKQPISLAHKSEFKSKFCGNHMTVVYFCGIVKLAVHVFSGKREVFGKQV